MELFKVFAWLTVLTACFSWVNHKYLHLPKTVGLMMISLAISIALALSDAITGFALVDSAAKTVGTIDFSETLLKIVLSFLLFAGALHIDLDAFLKQGWAIGILSTLGVIISASIIGILLWVTLPLFGVPLPFSMCLLFGALISPTDPVAVLALLKESKVPHTIEMKIAGESLFNDGAGVVLFLAIFAVATGVQDVSAGYVMTLLFREVFGGIVLGFITGFVAYELLRRIDNYQVEILLSLALVVGGYALAQELHVSGPLAMVVAGLIIGNRGRRFAMSEQTRKNLDLFWEVVDDILNASLFVLVGFEALLLNVKPVYVFVGLMIIPIALSARFASVWISSRIARPFQKWSQSAVLILTWGGLRGGISFALALALPHGEARDMLLLATYMVVVFSILVQGLTMKRMLARVGEEKPVA